MGSDAHPCQNCADGVWYEYGTYFVCCRCEAKYCFRCEYAMKEVDRTCESSDGESCMIGRISTEDSEMKDGCMCHPNIVEIRNKPQCFEGEESHLICDSCLQDPFEPGPYALINKLFSLQTTYKTLQELKQVCREDRKQQHLLWIKKEEERKLQLTQEYEEVTKRTKVVED